MLIKIKNFLAEYIFLIPIVGLFGVIYVNPKWFFILIGFLTKQPWLSPEIKTFFEKPPHEVVDQFISPVRGIVFVLSLAVLLVLLWKDIDREALQGIVWPRWSTALFGFLVLSLFFLHVGFHSIANEYAETSLMYFTKIQPINGGDRFLMPALAHVLFFRGPAFYYIFTLVCILLLLYCVLLWFARNNVSLPFWEFISLGTVSFIAFEFFNPGFPDVLVHILILLVLTLPVKEKGWLILFAFSMATHEASVFIWTILALFFLNRLSWVKFFVVLGLYILLRFASSGFEISTTFASHPVAGMTSFEWLFRHPDLEVLGLFFAFKAGWLIILMAMIGWIRKKSWRDFLMVGSLVGAGVFMTFEGIDTARLAGWAFPALLFSWKFLAEDENPLQKKFARFAKVINLIIPTYSVGLNLFFIPPGLYKTVVDWFLQGK